MDINSQNIVFASFRSKKGYLKSIFGKFIFCKLPPIEPKFGKSFIKHLLNKNLMNIAIILNHKTIYTKFKFNQIKSGLNKATSQI